MAKSLMLAIDCGTQSIRGILIDPTGQIIAKAKVEFEPYFSDLPGWAEQDPELYWQGLIQACQTLKTEYPEEWARIIGVSVTTQRDTCVCLDKKGQVLRPAILWLDQRHAECRKPLPLWVQLALSAVKMKDSMELVRKKSCANWIKENQPQLWEKTDKYLLLSGYFNYKLTGEAVDSIAAQIGHIPFDYKNKKWLSSRSFKWEVFGVERDKLPTLVDSGQILGYISSTASEKTGIKKGLPVVSSGSDKGCETLAVGCANLEWASLSFGSTATIQTTSDYYFEPLKFFPSYPAVIPGKYNPEVEIFRGYWMISWFKQEFSTREMIEAKKKGILAEQLLNLRLKEVPAGSQGLFLQPYWGPGLKNPEAKGAIIGFGDVHTRAHIYRSIIEGINYALLDGLEKIEARSGQQIKKIAVSGGGSQSDVICQITANMFNRPVYRIQTYETSGLGAAIAGFVGLKLFRGFDQAIKNMVYYHKVFEAEPDQVKVYSRLYKRVYKKIYPRLQKLYREIKTIINY